MRQKGIVISIDFELDWGYSNSKNPLNPSEVLEGLNKLIKLLEKHQVKSTWAIVGKLFENNDKEDDTKKQLNWISNNLLNNTLVEIGSHTYTHIFCEEVPLDIFKKDVSAMNEVSIRHEVEFKSIVFPRNQFDDSNLIILKKNQYTHFRDVLDKWYLKTNKYSNESIIKRYIIRFFELIPLNRDVVVRNSENLISVSDSRFFRFFSLSVMGKIIAPFYFMILKMEMRQSIKREKLYHIWFHPHNIIKNPNGFKQFDMFLGYYNKIKKQNESLSTYKLSEINN